MKSETSVQSKVMLGPRRRKPECLRDTETLFSNQSPRRFCSIAISSITTRSPVSLRLIARSRNSPSTRSSPGRCWKRRTFSRPVITTVPGSIEVTRVIGMKIRRRGGTSTISPRMRGAEPVCRVAIASRTFPT